MQEQHRDRRGTQVAGFWRPAWRLVPSPRASRHSRQKRTQTGKGNIATSAPLVKRCLRAGTLLGRCQGRCGISATSLYFWLVRDILHLTLPQMRPASCYVSCPPQHENLTASSRSLLTRAGVAKCLISLGKLVNKAKGENGERNFRYLYILYTFLFLF